MSGLNIWADDGESELEALATFAMALKYMLGGPAASATGLIASLAHLAGTLKPVPTPNGLKRR